MLNEFFQAVNIGLLWFNAVACVLIFISLFLYQSAGARFHRGKSFLAVMLMIASAAIPIMTWFGLITQTCIPYSVVVVALLVAVMNAKGNIAKLSKPFTK
ncbi:phage holin family protein [Scandinavium sp. H11S7]|uniref:Phage holin family protein n=1 Tax=Scandinavium hiltneri TaxID=2926519 RepID=A0ABT2E524_9ENTR|nr:phage holin family protein [Scandinavium hiltneri]MCS2162981.1 phage holin family protein [Scandinavium hiltneri]